MPRPTCGTPLIAPSGERRAESCPRCRAIWREDLHALLDVDPSGGDVRPRKLGPRSIASEYRWRLA
jgi:hypothetical protein